MQPESVQHRTGALVVPTLAGHGGAPASVEGQGPHLPRGLPPQLSPTPDAMALLRAFRRRWRLALAGGTAACLVAGLAMYRIMPAAKYSTSSLVYVAEQRPRDLFETRESSVAYRTYQETQTILIKSRMVLEAALKDPEVAGLESLAGLDDPVGWLSDRIEVSFPKGSEILKVSLKGDDPGDLAPLVNAVTRAYLELIVEKERSERLARLDRLKSLFAQYQEELKAKRQQFREMASNVGANSKQSTAWRQQMSAEHLARTNEELGKLQSDVRQAEIRFRLAMSRRRPRAAAMDPAAMIEEIVRRDPVIARQDAELAGLQAQLGHAERVARSPANDPYARLIRRKIATLQGERAERRRAIYPQAAATAREAQGDGEGGEVDEAKEYLAILREQEATLAEEVASLGEELKSFNVKTMDLQWLEDEIGLTSEVAKTVGSEVQAMSVELQAQPRIRLIELAAAPALSDPMRKYKMSGAAAAGAFALVVFGVSFLEFRNRRISTASEVADGLHIRLLGALPSLDPACRGPRPELRQRLLIESIDVIRAILLHVSRVEPTRVVMVSSATKGEGKTTLACHLAVSLSRAGRRTLLVDCDLRAPSVDRFLDVAAVAGLAEVLRGEVELDAAIQRLPLSDLSVLAVGRADAAAIELLACERWRGLLEELEGRYDFIIIDSPPVLLVSDGLILGQHADAVILSVLSAVSRAPKVYEAYQRLLSVGSRVLGAVVSGTPFMLEHSSYSYPLPEGRMAAGDDVSGSPGGLAPLRSTSDQS